MSSSEMPGSSPEPSWTLSSKKASLVLRWVPGSNALLGPQCLPRWAAVAGRGRPPVRSTETDGKLSAKPWGSRGLEISPQGPGLRELSALPAGSSLCAAAVGTLDGPAPRCQPRTGRGFSTASSQEDRSRVRRCPVISKAKMCPRSVSQAEAGRSNPEMPEVTRSQRPCPGVGSSQANSMLLQPYRKPAWPAVNQQQF